MHVLIQDLRYALRQMRRSPGFAAIAIAALALGIGANTAIFSVIDAVLLRPLPYRQPSQLVDLYETEAAPGQYPFAGPDFLDWKTETHSFQDMTLYSWEHDMNLSGLGRPDHVVDTPTEANFFSLLGVRPLLGRAWALGEDEPGKDQVAILSYGLWRSHFAGNPGIVGRTIELDAKKYAVIGVMPASFNFPSETQLWTPLDMDAKDLGSRGSHSYAAIGRLKPGVTLQQAQAEMTLIARRLEQRYPDSNYKVGASLTGMHDDLVGDARASLWMMLWAAALVLLIACANVANLLLSRALARQKEMAVRSALGAGRGRLVRQLLTESVLLAVIGGGIGLLLAEGGLRLIAALKNTGIPLTNPIQLNGAVLAFTFALAVLTGVIFGLAPAFQTARPDVHDELKGGAGSTLSPSRRRRLASDTLVVAEIGLSLLLLVAAGLLLKSFVRLRGTAIGVRPQGMLTAAVDLPSAKYSALPQIFAFSRELLRRAQSLPGVEAAAISDRLPLEGGSNGYINLRGQPFHPMSGLLVEAHEISPGYFHVMGIPLLRGREFTDADVAANLAVNTKRWQLWEQSRSDLPPAQRNATIFPVVINQTMARDFWPNQNPIGQMFSHGSATGPWEQVIGVVGDVKERGNIARPAMPEAYDVDDGEPWMYLVVHASVPPLSLVGAIRGQLAQLDSSLSLYSVRTMDQVIADHAAGQQVLSLLIGLFAGLALLLAAVGIYGVMSYLVTQRTREVGIRMALGASRGQVLGQVLRDGMRLAAFGLALGILGALAVGRLLAASLYQVAPDDPSIFLLTAAALALVALAACYLPARRAARVDPMVALRQE